VCVCVTIVMCACVLRVIGTTRSAWNYSRLVHRPAAVILQSRWIGMNYKTTCDCPAFNLSPLVHVQSTYSRSTLSPLSSHAPCRAFSVTPDSHQSEDEELVYVNSNKNYLVPAYASLCVSSVVVLGITAHMYWNYFVLGIPPRTVEIENPMLYAFLGNVFGISLLVVTRYLLSRTFIRIYYNPTSRNFTGEGYTWRLRKSETVFAAGSAKQLDVPAGLSELRGNYLINGRPIYLNAESFKSPVHYNLMMGFVKPNK